MGSGENAVIELIASDVVIEGDGHTISGGGTDKPGIWVRGSEDRLADRVQINNITVQNCFYGIHATDVSSLALRQITARENLDHGIYLFTVVHSEVSNCTVRDNQGSGIVISDVSEDNRIEANTVAGNDHNGLMLIVSNRNRMLGNTVQDNGAFGIDCFMTSHNIIADNFFSNVNNTRVQDLDSNTWSLPVSAGPNIAGGPSRGGNYWGSSKGRGFSDLTPDADGDGFCDSPYILHGTNIDELPLKGSGNSLPTPTGSPGFGWLVCLVALGFALDRGRR
ncbi:MAG: hypothetical protein GXY82_03015 [Methanospirillum sp.]|nr:hypothetical protein [Methanospirillum sp.]